MLLLTLLIVFCEEAVAQRAATATSLEQRIQALEYAANDASDAAGIALETRYKVGLLEGEVETANKLLGGLLAALLTKVGADIYATRRRR